MTTFERGSRPVTILSADQAAALVYRGLPVPLCVLDGQGALVGMNPQAEALWATSFADVAGAPCAEVLRIEALDGGAAGAEAVGTALRLGTRVPCRITDRASRTHVAALVALCLRDGDAAYTLLVVVEERTAQVLADPPEWALRDAATGLGNRHRWDREAAGWNRRSGAVVFFDLDNLKEFNDLYGHGAGDQALLLAARAIAAEFPEGDALAVRYGGDEFVVALNGATEAVAHACACRAEARLAREAAVADLPLIPQLSHGTAAFAPGTLDAAVQRADDALYEQRGVLLRAAGGGRLVLTRDGRRAVSGADHRHPVAPGAFASGFNSQFDRYFRAQYAQATEQARDFVRFVAPAPGSAVVEVGAGSGRITFDGGLAACIGPEGQLLVTDPSDAQLQAARERAHALGTGWLRFLPAPAERLPLVSGTADLVLGALFLHFTDPGRALREMARVVRQGGRVAVSTMLEWQWSDLWREVLTPVWSELERRGLPARHPFPSEAALRGHVASAGLRIERCRVRGPDPWEFPDVELALPMIRQIGLVSLLLRGVPEDRHTPLREAVEGRLRAAFARSTPAQRAQAAHWMDLVATRA